MLRVLRLNERLAGDLRGVFQYVKQEIWLLEYHRRTPGKTKSPVSLAVVGRPPSDHQDVETGDTYSGLLMRVYVMSLKWPHWYSVSWRGGGGIQ